MRELDTKPAAKAYEASDSNEAKNEDLEVSNRAEVTLENDVMTCNLRYCQVWVLIRWNVLIQGWFQVDSVDTVFQYVSCILDVVPFFGETHGEPFEAPKFALLSVLWTPSVGH